MKTKTNLIIILFCVFVLAPLFSCAFEHSTRLYSKLVESEPTLIESLQDGGSFSIEITSIGCFNGTRKTIQIYKKEGIIIAELEETSKELTAKDMTALRTFELQLRALKKGGCTTVDTYVLRFGNQTFQTSDGTCSWHGYRKLLEIFS